MKSKLILAIFMIGIQILWYSEGFAQTVHKLPPPFPVKNLISHSTEEKYELMIGGVNSFLPEQGTNSPGIILVILLADQSDRLLECSNPYVTCLGGRLEVDVPTAGFEIVKFSVVPDAYNSENSILLA